MARRIGVISDGKDLPKLGRKISAEEFIDNYMCNLPGDEPKSKKKPPIILDKIYNPVRIPYSALLKTTYKAYLIEFAGGGEFWLSKRLTRLDKKNKIITMPKRFAEENALEDLII